MLAKYGFSADVLLIPGYAAHHSSVDRRRLGLCCGGCARLAESEGSGSGCGHFSTLANFSSQRVLIRPDSRLTGFKDLKGKLIGVTQYGSGGDTFLRGALRKTGIKEYEVTILQMGGTPGVAQGLESGRIRSRRARRLGHAAGVSRFGETAEWRERAGDGFSRHRCANHDHRAQDQIGPPAASCASCRLILKPSIFLKPIKRDGTHPEQVHARRERRTHYALVR